jgi:hypothetical protein
MPNAVKERSPDFFKFFFRHFAEVRRIDSGMLHPWESTCLSFQSPRIGAAVALVWRHDKGLFHTLENSHSGKCDDALVYPYEGRPDLKTKTAGGDTRFKIVGDFFVKRL